MRAYAMAALLLAAGCSGGGEEKKEAKAAGKLKAGQWETVIEVADLRSTDKAPPAIKAEKGSRTTISTCVGEDDTAKPPPEMFAGKQASCQYRDAYVRRGRLNISLTCTQPGLRGDIMRNVDGSFTDETLEANVVTTSFLVTDGDVEIREKVTGRRTGECTAETGKNESGGDKK